MIKENEIVTKSLKINMILNVIKSLTSVIFPLITFPYISRVLGAEQIGRFNFSNSIVSYIVLLSGLGIAAYARSEGSSLRDNREDISNFSSEMFTINIVTTMFAYAVLLVLIFFVPMLQGYTKIILILSLTVLLQTIGVEWIYNIYEDYGYITLRTIIFQFFSILFLFLFVKNRSDLEAYAWIIVISNAGSNIFNYFHAKKYVKLKVCTRINWKKHVQPILVFFSMAVSVTIYASSDITILGIFCGDYEVGLYSVSAKVYTIVKNVLAAIVTVTIPRLCYLVGKEKRQDFVATANDLYRLLISIVLPAVIGLMIFSKEIILIIAGSEYLNANTSLFILGIAMVCCLFAYFWGQSILVPLHMEKISLMAATVSAAINIVLNILLIPIWRQNAAAFTTLLSELTAMIIGIYFASKKIKLPDNRTIWLKTGAGCMYIVLVCIIIRSMVPNNFIKLGLGVIVSVIGYFTIEIVLKNDAILGLFNKYYKKN